MPPGVAARPRDPRGFPITFVTLIQQDGTADFTTIDGQKILRCVNERLCGLCGVGFWDDETNIVAFIGGPLSCEHRNFLDPPMHVACAEYAMQVCPHIAIDTSRYSKPKVGGPEERELFPYIAGEPAREVRALPGAHIGLPDRGHGGPARVPGRPPDRREVERMTWLTVDEIADQLRVSKMTIYRLIHASELNATKVGGQFRVTQDDLDTYLGKRKS